MLPSQFPTNHDEADGLLQVGDIAGVVANLLQDQFKKLGVGHLIGSGKGVHVDVPKYAEWSTVRGGWLVVV